MRCRSAFGITPPVGLPGELRTTSFVFGDRLCSNVSRSNENPRSSTSGIGTRVAPRKSTSDS